MIFVAVVNGLTFSERKNELIKILGGTAEHRSYTYNKRRRYKIHSHSSSSSSSSESHEKRLRYLNSLYAKSNPRYYNDYPGN